MVKVAFLSKFQTELQTKLQTENIYYVLDRPLRCYIKECAYCYFIILLIQKSKKGRTEKLFHCIIIPCLFRTGINYNSIWKIKYYLLFTSLYGEIDDDSFQNNLKAWSTYIIEEVRFDLERVQFGYAGSQLRIVFISYRLILALFPRRGETTPWHEALADEHPASVKLQADSDVI